MNRVFIIILLINFVSFGQIKTTKVAQKFDSQATKPYDSLSNFLGKDAKKYVGQTLYLKGIRKDLRQFGYPHFYTANETSGFEENVYKCCDSYNSKYDDLKEKYFKVLEVTKENLDDKMLNHYITSIYYFKLQEKESGDILYFAYDSESDWEFPFIVVGFFEKLKKQTIGKEFIFGSTDLRFGAEQIDIKTGKTIFFELGEKWKCTDVTIDEENYNLSLLLKDNNKQNLVLNYNTIIGKDKFFNVFTAKEAEKYKAKFGLENWKSILRGKVKIGMTKEMSKLSWGEPDDINATITSNRKSEQWVYGDNYLYFENGIVKAIQ